MKEKSSKKRTGIIVGILLAVLIIPGILLIGLLSALFIPEKEKITQTEQYETYLGESGKYKENYVGYNDIFPDSLEKVSRVEDFVYYYYNPFDANYFGYLVCEYSADEFDKEVARLNSLESESYNGVYGIEEFPYEVCAVYADEVYGVMYALADREEKEIIYVSLEFCNYFTDIDYKEMMDEKYLPVGFDAMPGNETRKAFDRK
ncbi:MAG: hypothetical protein IJZ76_03945 [Lachnospiraceae bacterium]|nr:hypothetical protein [Lachnospiraceae bacterium]